MDIKSLSMHGWLCILRLLSILLTTRCAIILTLVLGKCSDLKESTTCTVGMVELGGRISLRELMELGSVSPRLHHPIQMYYLEWSDYTESPSNQRQFTFSPSVTSKYWYHYGMPQVSGSDLTFSITGGSMTFGEIDLLVCKKDNPQLLYPASVNVCYRGLPCTISPLAVVPGSVTAQNLPTGLSCNRNTGVISGTLHLCVLVQPLQSQVVDMYSDYNTWRPNLKPFHLSAILECSGSVRIVSWDSRQSLPVLPTRCRLCRDLFPMA